jgi:hypothetical protein
MVTAADHATCPTCDGDGYLDIVDDWGGVIGSAPCPACADANLDRSDLGLEPTIDRRHPDYADDPWGIA